MWKFSLMMMIAVFARFHISLTARRSRTRNGSAADARSRQLRSGGLLFIVEHTVGLLVVATSSTLDFLITRYTDECFSSDVVSQLRPLFETLDLTLRRSLVEAYLSICRHSDIQSNVRFRSVPSYVRMRPNMLHSQSRSLQRSDPSLSTYADQRPRIRLALE